jgi:hypothetical protein
MAAAAGRSIISSITARRPRSTWRMKSTATSPGPARPSPTKSANCASRPARPREGKARGQIRYPRLPRHPAPERRAPARRPHDTGRRVDRRRREVTAETPRPRAASR